MLSNIPGATARQFERKATRRVARIEVHSDHADQFRLSFPDAQSEVFITDISKGGIGIASSVFIPRNLRLNVHVPQTEAGQDLTIRVVARRCGLADHKPTYDVGLQFIDASGSNEQALIALAASDQAANAAEALL